MKKYVLGALVGSNLMLLLLFLTGHLESKTDSQTCIGKVTENSYRKN